MTRKVSLLTRSKASKTILQQQMTRMMETVIMMTITRRIITMMMLAISKMKKLTMTAKFQLPNNKNLSLTTNRSQMSKQKKLLK